MDAVADYAADSRLDVKGDDQVDLEAVQDADASAAIRRLEDMFTGPVDT